MPGKGTAEQWFRALLRGPLFTRTPGTNPWAGKVTIPSGSTVHSITTALVNSDSQVLFGIEQTTVVSLGLSPLVVKSINPGVSFTVGWANNTAIAQDIKASYLIILTS